MNKAYASSDAVFLRRAICLARERSQTKAGGPFGAVVVCAGKIVSRGWNKVTSSNDPTAHAEIVAIRAGCRKLGRFHLHDCVLYTSCEPCPMCLGAAYWARVDRIVYAADRQDAAKIGFDDARIYSELSLSRDLRLIRMEQLLREEAVSVMQAWKAMPNRPRY